MIQMSGKPEIVKKVNTLFKKDEATLPKWLIFLFKLIEILYSYDLGGFTIKSKKMKLIAKSLSLAKCCIVVAAASIILYYYKNKTTSSFYYSIMIQYISMALIFAYYKEMSFADYQKLLLKFDGALRINKNSQKLYIKMLLFLLFYVILRLCFVNIYCFYFDKYCIRPVSLRIFVMAVFMSLDLISLLYFFIFYTTRCRLSKLVMVLEKSSSSVEHLQHLYKGLIDSIETVKRPFDASYVLLLLFNGSGVMFSLYTTLIAIIKNSFIDVIPGLIVGCISNLQLILVTFSPPLCAGMLSWQAESIKIALHNRLLFEKDKNNYSDIKRFISYVEARPFKLRACRVIPLDCSLLVLALNFCVTYLIVLVQFTHLY